MEGGRPAVSAPSEAPGPIGGSPIVDGSIEDGSLSRQVRSGFRWSIANTILTRAWTLGLGIVLARILDPGDYGVYTVALVVLGILQSMNELGVSVAVVQWQGDPTRVARTAVTLSAAASGVLYAACFAGAPFLASALSSPGAAGVLRLLAVGVLFDGLSSIPNAFLTRNLQQSRRALADVGGLVTSTAVTLSLALDGHGAWSLAWGALAGNAVATGLIMALAPTRPRPGFDRQDARRLLGYGLPLAGSSFLLFAMLNADYIAVGRNLGPVALGFYALAFNLSSWPVNILSFSIRRVSIAGFARLAADPGRLHDRFVRSFGHLVSLVVPPALFLGLLAEPLVRFVYGDRWAPAAEALGLLALVGGLRVLFDFCYDLFVAKGRSRMTLALQGLWLAALVPALYVGTSTAGIRGAGAAHAAVALAVVSPAFLLALHRTGIDLGALTRASARPVAAGALAAAVVLSVRATVAGDLAVLAVGGSAATATYIAVVIPRREARAWVQRRRRSTSERVPVSPPRP